MFEIAASLRYRRSPYYDATVAAGVTGFAPYNQMLLPSGYGDPDAEYWRVINGVSLWDVACERQVELVGPDAAALAQALSPRDLTRCAVGQGKYVALCNHDGVLLNDPILLKVAEDRYWLSIADSNILFWARAIAAERKMDVRVFEPDVSPLALQGPMAEDVVASLFGDWVRDLRYFWFRETSLEGIPLVVARSGFSKQGGFELYLMDGSRGVDLWNLCLEAGRPWNIGPGNPTLCERVESGLLSCGADTDDTTNPLEVRMERYVDFDVPDDVVGIQALRQIRDAGPARHQLGLVLDGDAPMDPIWRWEPILKEGKPVGHLTNSVWSRRMKKNIGYALVNRSCEIGDVVEVDIGEATFRGALVDLPFL